jgi:hypothetical protein
VQRLVAGGQVPELTGAVPTGAAHPAVGHPEAGVVVPTRSHLGHADQRVAVRQPDDDRGVGVGAEPVTEPAVAPGPPAPGLTVGEAGAAVARTQPDLADPGQASGTPDAADGDRQGATHVGAVAQLAVVVGTPAPELPAGPAGAGVRGAGDDLGDPVQRAGAGRSDDDRRSQAGGQIAEAQLAVVVRTPTGHAAADQAGARVVGAGADLDHAGQRAVAEPVDDLDGPAPVGLVARPQLAVVVLAPAPGVAVDRADAGVLVPDRDLGGADERTRADVHDPGPHRVLEHPVADLAQVPVAPAHDLPARHDRAAGGRGRRHPRRAGERRRRVGCRWCRQAEAGGGRDEGEPSPEYGSDASHGGPPWTCERPDG